MPIYDYECTCGNKELDRYSRIDEREPCPECGLEMRRLISSRFGINMGVGAYGYYDENLDTYIHTNAHKRRVMQEQGVHEKFGKGWI